MPLPTFYHRQSLQKNNHRHHSCFDHLLHCRNRAILQTMILVQIRSSGFHIFLQLSTTGQRFLHGRREVCRYRSIYLWMRCRSFALPFDTPYRRGFYHLMGLQFANVPHNGDGTTFIIGDRQVAVWFYLFRKSFMVHLAFLNSSKLIL